jgi:hypothetical protein
MRTKKMATEKSKKTEPGPLEITIDIRTERLECFLIGTSPLLMNRMSEKVRQGLLLPPLEKNKAERQSTLKHEPVKEFRDSVYRFRGNNEPTRLLMPAGAFKDAIAKTALRIPGATKTEIGQLVQIAGSIDVPIYGVPKLHMSVVRQAGINKTPDIRTRAYLPRWCCKISLDFVVPLLSYMTVQKLVAAAGLIMGIGDGRPEKGKLTHGKFDIVNDDDKLWNEIVRKEGRVAQDKALEHFICADEESESLLAWYDGEIARRRSRPPEEPKKRRGKKGNGEELRLAAERLTRGIDELEV